MKLLFDLLPVVVFFGVFRLAKAFPQFAVAWTAAWAGSLGDTPAQQSELAAVLLSTASAIVVAVAQISWLLARRQPVKPAVWLSAILVFVFGGLTLWFHNEWFIKWKPTILYGIFALALLGGKWIWRRNLLGSLLSKELELELPGSAWDRLMYAWSLFFLLLGALNLYFAYNWSTEAWVNFKTIGSMGATLAFSLATGLYVARYLPAGDDPAAHAASEIAPRGGPAGE